MPMRFHLKCPMCGEKLPHKLQNFCVNKWVELTKKNIIKSMDTRLRNKWGQFKKEHCGECGRTISQVLSRKRWCYECKCHRLLTKEILEKAAKETNRAQKEFMEKPAEKEGELIRTGYLQTLGTVECGNCHPEKFQDCKEVFKGTNMKCECKCHAPTQTPEWNKRCDGYCNHSQHIKLPNDWKSRMKYIKSKSCELGGVVINEELLNEQVFQAIESERERLIKQLLEELPQKAKAEKFILGKYGEGHADGYNVCLLSIKSILTNHLKK